MSGGASVPSILRWFLKNTTNPWCLARPSGTCVALTATRKMNRASPNLKRARRRRDLPTQAMPLRREWFFEKRDGNCRLMASFALQLSATAPTWGRAVAPLAEGVARIFSSSIPKRSKRIFPSTRLTQNSRREGRGISANLSIEAPLVVLNTAEHVRRWR